MDRCVLEVWKRGKNMWFADFWRAEYAEILDEYVKYDSKLLGDFLWIIWCINLATSKSINHWVLKFQNDDIVELLGHVKAFWRLFLKLCFVIFRFYLDKFCK